MAMTKAERALVEDLTKARDLARALRWPEGPVPQPYTEEEVREACDPGGLGYVSGWGFNAHTKQVSPAWTRLSQHRLGYASPGEMSQHAVATRGMGRVYRTAREAYGAMRFELTIKYATELAEIDRKIAESFAA